MSVALSGIRILDFTRIIQGPQCTKLLADMGAEVIKVERMNTGEEGRYIGTISVGGTSANFLAVNRNKKSMTLNLKCKEGKAIVLKLVKDCDVVVHNFRPGVMERLGLDYNCLSSVNSQIIYCSCSGYGETGPYRKKAGQDLIVQGMSGIISITGEAGRTPVAPGAPIVDMYAGSLAAYGIVVALFHRERTGVGQKIEACLLNAAIDIQAQEITAYLNTLVVPRRGGRGVGHISEPPPYGVFATKDGYITLVGGYSFSKVCKALGIPHLSQDEKFSTPQRRLENRDELTSLLENTTQKKSTRDWVEIMESEDIMCGPVYTYDQVASDPQVLENGMVLSFDYSQLGNVKTTGFPLKLSKTPSQCRISPPTVGQHTEEILLGLGYQKEEITKLREEGVI